MSENSVFGDGVTLDATGAIVSTELAQSAQPIQTTQQLVQPVIQPVQQPIQQVAQPIQQQVAQPQQVIQPQQAVQQAQPQQLAFPQVDLSVALAGLPGVSVGDMGMKVSRVPIEKFKATTQKIDRISFITSQTTAIKTHYIEGNGSIICFERKCCELCGIPTVRYTFPVVVYSTDNDGNIISGKIELKVLSAGEDLYKSIRTIHIANQALGGIDNVDLLVVCTDDNYQKITLNAAGPAQWKRSQAAITFVSERWAADAKYMYMAIARKVEEKDFPAMMGLESGSGISSPAISPNTDVGSFFNN